MVNFIVIILNKNVDVNKNWILKENLRKLTYEICKLFIYVIDLKVYKIYLLNCPCKLLL